MSLTRSVRDLLDRVASFVDVDVRRRGSRWHRARDLPRVPTVVDVGVGKGGTPPLYRLFPDSRFILIDPLEECRRGVRSLLAREGNLFVPAALGSANGSTTIHVPGDVSHASLLQPVDGAGEGGGEAGVESREVPLRRLDDVLAEIGPEGPLGLKVDTEGYELRVLDGAPETLARTAFVILEVNVRKRFEGSYSFEEAIRYMSDVGFSVHAVLHAGSGKCDIAFTSAHPGEPSDP